MMTPPGRRPSLTPAGQPARGSRRGQRRYRGQPTRSRYARGQRPRHTSAPGVTRRDASPSRATIGDQLRRPAAWCEMGSCIWHHADPAALGEADIRARAISAGWRVDALGRLACPRCQQTSPGFRATCPVTLWDRDNAITSAALTIAVMRYRRAASSPGRQVGRA